MQNDKYTLLFSPSGMHMTKYVKVSLSLPEETKEKLDHISKEEMRTMSNMVAYLIEKYEK